MYISIITVLIALVAVGIPTTMNVSASQEEPDETQTYVKEERELESGFYREDGYPKDTKNRPAINPDFDPDESCDLKWELKCIPGSEQTCRDLEGYDNGEMNVCTPRSCPEGYHNIAEWEDNVCYSNDEECPEDTFLVEKTFGMQCAYEVLVSTEKPEIVDPIETDRGTSACPDGYQRTDDGERCQLKDVQCDEEPDNSLCNGERGREGNIFCDIQQEEGGNETCYDRYDIAE
jgi:hypothetical protein